MFRSILFFSALIFFLLLFPACVNDPAKVNSITKKDNLPTQTAHSVDMLYTDSAKLKIHLTAPELEVYEGNSTNYEMKSGVKVEFFNDSGTVDSYLTANYAIRKEREHTMMAKNNVVLVNTKGERLNTEELIWNESTRRIHTDAFVTITTADQVIQGTGLDSDETFTDYEIKNISGTINLKDEEKGDK
jgi:LPS export ABC transporter protein LptC